MSDVVTKVLQISPATDWFFDSYQFTGKLSDYEPVALFALVETISAEHASLGCSQAIVPIKADELGLYMLVGTKLSELQREVVHAAKILADAQAD